MKKIISRIILGSLILGLSGILLWKIIIEPSMDLYSKYGIAGVGYLLMIIGMVACVFYVITKIIDWAIDNCD